MVSPSPKLAVHAALVVLGLFLIIAGVGAEWNDDLHVPNATWPVPRCSTTTEDNDHGDKDASFETLIHPGDGTTQLKVPPFWSAPVHQHKLLSRETAMTIGTCTQVDPATGSFTRGDACPLGHCTIYVTIASYRDFECRTTVESLLSRARYPDRIRLGIVDQRRSRSGGISTEDGEEDVACTEPCVPCQDDPTQLL